MHGSRAALCMLIYILIQLLHQLYNACAHVLIETHSARGHARRHVRTKLTLLMAAWQLVGTARSNGASRGPSGGWLFACVPVSLLPRRVVVSSGSSFESLRRSVPGTSRSGDDDPISSSVSGCSPRRPVQQKHCTGTTTYVAPSSMRIRASHKLRVRMHCDIDYARPHTCRFTRPGPATPASGEP